MEVIDFFKAPRATPMAAPLEQKIARPVCQLCGSPNTIRKGYRVTRGILRQVIKCKECGRKSTLEGKVYLSPPWTTAPCIGCSCEHPGFCMRLGEWLLRKK